VLLLLGSLTVSSARNPQPAKHIPVLLELFTSEGCSSCPPADKLLQRLDREQPFEGADLIVLSEHVDYWNHDGWTDPYSSPQFSKRQERYSTLLDSDVYTPQVVVDGSRQMVGSDSKSIAAAVRALLHAPGASVEVKARKEANDLQVHVEVSGLQASRHASVYLVLAADRARSHVMRGENAGRELEHVAVVESLMKIGEISPGSSFQKDVRSAFAGKQNTEGLRVAVFVQDDASGHVLGAAEDRL
jgi:hypothetical protein